jgi:hypothetical protein
MVDSENIMPDSLSTTHHPLSTISPLPLPSRLIHFAIILRAAMALRGARAFPKRLKQGQEKAEAG